LTRQTETMFKMKRSASAAVKKAFNELIDTIPLPINKAMESIIFYFVDEDINRSWLYYLNKLKMEGKLYLTEEERQEFMADLSSQAMKKFTYELDPSSRLLIMGATNDRDTINFHMRFPDCLVSNFKLPGTYGVIDGLPRTGKTSLATTFMEILYQIDFNIITNIALDDPPHYIHYVRKLSDMVKVMDEQNRWVAILDETGTFVGRKRAVSKENVDFENLARFVGKMGGRLILITHSFELDVPSLLQEWTTERFSKTALDTAMVHLSRDGGYIKMHKQITGIPDADMKYITEDITSLQFDISIKKLLQRIQDGVSIKKAVDEQLQKKEETSTNSRGEKKERILEKLEQHPDASYEEIAVLADVTYDYARKIIKKAKAMKK